MCNAESRISGSSSENSVGKATHTDLPGSSTAVAPADSAKTARGMSDRPRGMQEPPQRPHIFSLSSVPALIPLLQPFSRLSTNKRSGEGRIGASTTQLKWPL